MIRTFRTLLPLLAALALLAAWQSGEKPARKPRETVVIEGTLEAARGQPLVHVQLRDDDRILTAEPDPLQSLLGGDDAREATFRAYLDTGSSSLVLSESTARRFGVSAVPDAVYLEAGLHGDVAMGVSRQYQLGLAGLLSIDAAVGECTPTLRKAAFQLNRAKKATGLLQVAGALDVIGMPAIEKLVVEIDPTPLAKPLPEDDPLAALAQLIAAPAVHLHPARKRPSPADVTVSLEMMDFTRRRHPGHEGPRPALASNPMVTVSAEHGGAEARGQWLLDTGAAAAVISTATAKTLKLLDDQGNPVRPPDFTLPLGGISGKIDELPGFVVDRLRIPAGRTKELEFRRAHVVVRDVSIEITPGEKLTLDGIVGMNLLFPSASGIGAGLPGAASKAPFRRVWIDGPRRRLVLELAGKPEPKPSRRKRR